LPSSLFFVNINIIAFLDQIHLRWTWYDSKNIFPELKS
jgi:hypothetical protein